MRLFVALELPQDARDELLSWRSAAIAGHWPLRQVGPEALHVTLCFLGWREGREIPSIAGACELVADRPAARLTLGAPVWLPRRRPRVLAVELHDARGGLSAVQASLSQALASGGWYEPEARPFYAHVTVARVPKGARAPRDELPAPAALGFTGRTITLLRSRLSAAGARYEALASVELSARVAG